AAAMRSLLRLRIGNLWNLFVTTTRSRQRRFPQELLFYLPAFGNQTALAESTGHAAQESDIGTRSLNPLNQRTNRREKSPSLTASEVRGTRRHRDCGGCSLRMLSFAA